MNMKPWTRTLLTATALCSLTASPALAQITPAQQEILDSGRSISDPSRIKDQFLGDSGVPNVSSKIEVRDIVLQKAPPGAENVKFTFKSLQIDGVSVYGKSDLSPIYDEKLGQVVTLADMYVMANAMTTKYRNDGYILSQVIIPPQTIEGGQIKFRVVEGFIDSISVRSEQSEKTNALIRTYASHLQGKSALNVGELERALLMINDLPGIEARTILSPSRTRTGGADMTLIVERNDYDAFIGIDNYGSRYLGPIQMTAAGSIYSWLDNNETISGQLVYAPDGGPDPELLFGAISYSQPIWDYGTTLDIDLIHSSTWPGYNLEQFDVEGRSQSLAITVEHPFIRSRSTNVYGRVSIDARNVESQNNLEATRKDRIRSLRVGGTVENLDTLFGVGINSIDLQISQGVTPFGASNENDGNLSRALGKPNYTKFELALQRLQRVTSDINLLFGFESQYSNDPLLSSEEFGVGGINIGRAYDASEIVGDKGVAGKVEVQWNEPKKFDLLHDYQLFAFFDAGKVWNKDPISQGQRRDSLTSTGLGIRADFTEDVQAGFMVAVPLSRDIETQGDDDPRFFMNVSRQF